MSFIQSPDVFPVNGSVNPVTLNVPPVLFVNVAVPAEYVPPVTNVFVSVSPDVPTTTNPFESIPKLLIGVPRPKLFILRYGTYTVSSVVPVKF